MAQVFSMGAGAFHGTSRFEVQGPLGSGSMCLVYRVRDRLHGDVVALKTLKHLDAGSLYRLKQEFRALSHLDHPNLVQFYELSASQDGWFVTMELVEGVDFLTWSRGEDEGKRHRERTESTWRESEDLRFAQSAPAGRAASTQTDTTAFQPTAGALPDVLRLRSTLRQLAEGVGALHGAGRIHRDLKPSNVLVTDAGRVVVLDFGLVAEIDQDYTEGTLHQNVAGSAAYMSPEQAMGRPLTEAADWYAVGVMLYEALTGVWPYHGHVYRILTVKQTEDPPAPSTLTDGVPEDLDALCMALLQRDPDARPTGPEVLARLRYRGSSAGLQALLEPSFRFREQELGAIRDAWWAAREGRAQVVALRGPRGAGRTRLLREVVKELRRDGAIPLKTRCYAWETLPIRAVDGLVDNLTRVLRRADHGLLRRLANEDLASLVAQFPTFARVDALDVVPASTDDVDPADLQDQALAQLRTVLKAVTRDGPLLLAVDDAHNADTDSADALVALLRPDLGDLPVLLLLSYPPEPPSPFVRWLLPLLGDVGLDVRIVDLRPLTEDEGTAMAAEMLGVPPGDDRAFRAAGEARGLPGLLREHVRDSLVADGRRAEAEGELNEVVAAEIDGLPAEPRRLLELLALARRPMRTATAITAARPTSAFQAITALRAHHLIAVTATDTLEVPLHRVAEFVLERMPPHRRTAHHQALAEALELSGEADPRSLVRHWRGAGRSERAAMVAWSGASEALSAGRWDEAAWLLERALELGEWSTRERGSMLGHLGQALIMSGRGADATARFLEAAEAFPQGSARMRLRAAEAALSVGALSQGEALLAPLLARAELPSLPAGLLAGSVGAWRRWRAPRLQDFEPRSATSVDVQQLMRVDAAWIAAEVLALLDPQRAAAMRPAHVEAALQVGEVDRALRAQASELATRAASGDASDLDDVLVSLRSRAQQLRSGVGEAFVASSWAVVALQSGRLAEAAEAGREAEVRLVRTHAGAGWQRLQVRAIALRARLWRGGVAEVRNQLDALLRRVREAHDAVGEVELAGGDLLLGILATDPDRAPVELESTRSAWRQAPPRPLALLEIASAWVALDRDDVAGADRAARAIPDLQDGWLTALTWRLRAHAALGAGDPRAAERAITQLEDPARPWTSAWAGLLRACGSGGDAAALASSRRALDAVGMHLDALAVGVVLDDQEATAAMVAAGVAAPRRFAGILVPIRT